MLCRHIHDLIRIIYAFLMEPLWVQDEGLFVPGRYNTKSLCPTIRLTVTPTIPSNKEQTPGVGPRVRL